MSRIVKDGINVYDENDWDEIVPFLVPAMKKLVDAFAPAIKNRSLANGVVDKV